MTAATALTPPADGWQDRAACGGTAPAFDLDRIPADQLRAEAEHLRDTYCARCPVARACLTDALTAQGTPRRACSTVRGGQYFNAHGRTAQAGPRHCATCSQPPSTPKAKYCADCRDPARAAACRATADDRTAAGTRCGSEAGARAHYRAGERPCPPCLRAARVARDERAARAEAAA
jgi:hypothetical protein